MTTNKFKALAAVGTLVVASIAAYWYWSPFLTIRQIQNAAQEKDADAFNDRVDYPKLRESMKGQFSAMMAEKMGSVTDSGNPFAALGAALGLVMVNQVVEAMVRPEAVMQAMRNGRFAAPSKSQVEPTPQENTAPGKEGPRFIYERKGTGKLIAYAADPGKPDEKNEDRFGLVFVRNGFADWKLTEVRLPMLNK
jgi:hypothetical protein